MVAFEKQPVINVVTEAAKNAAFTVDASETTASVAASASQSVLKPDSLPELKSRWLLLTNKVMVCKVHDGWRVGKVWKRGSFGVVLADTQPIALLAVVCWVVVLQDARPVSLFASPKERLTY